MLKLLGFEFRRIFKSIFFWIVAGFSFIWPVLTAVLYRALITLDLSDGIKFGPVRLGADEIQYLTWMIAVAFITELPKFIALFTCLHIGRDYSDGIIRNKIIAGHSRIAIYGSYIVSQMAATVCLCVIYIASALFGVAVSGIGVDLNGGEMFARFATAIVVFLVMTVSFTVLAVIFRRRALPLILSILIALSSNAVASVIGYFNTPGKACDGYLEVRNENYEELVELGYLDDDTADELIEKNDKDAYMGIGWKIFHPVYVVSPFGFEGDYQAGGVTSLISNSIEYQKELDFSSHFITQSFMLDDMAQVTPQQYRKIDSMQISYDELNWIYIGKSVAWMTVIAAYGFVVFRKKNLF